MPISSERGLFSDPAPPVASRRPFAWWRSVWLGLVLNALVLVPQAHALSVTLAWNPSPSGGVSGYYVHAGTSSGFYTNVTDVGNAASMIAPDLTAGVAYYFAITAYDADGNESGFSNELIYTPSVVPVREPATLQLKTTPAGGMRLTLTGPGNRTYDVLASSDLQQWTVIRVLSADNSGRFEFVDPDAANFPARFYRARETQPSVQLRLTPAGQVLLSVIGQNGYTYDVQASSDLATWTILGTVFLDESGAADFVDADAANYPARFYRTLQE